jgi:hypothetical protein
MKSPEGQTRAHTDVRKMTRILAFPILLLILFIVLSVTVQSQKTLSALPSGYWSLEKSQPLIEKTQTLRLAPDLSALSAGERRAVEKLLEVGRIFQSVYENQRHAQALSSLADLQNLDQKSGSSQATRNLLALYRLNQGPIAVTLDNKREPFLPVSPPAPEKNVYPPGATKELIESYLSGHPEKREELMHSRTVVRRASPGNLQRDLSVLRAYPVLDTLQPGLKAELTGLLRTGALPEKAHSEFAGSTFKDGHDTAGKLNRSQRAIQSGAFYAVPYSVAYADQLIKAYTLLNDAADAVRHDDQEFAGYLRNRARDLLSNDYESGDAAWVTGHFKNLNAQIGPYETYDDELYGVKTFFACSLLLTRQHETAALRQAMKGLQSLEDSLPYDQHKKIREDIPVGVYDVIADFGQARGGNTATILPNESYLARRYGRTILLRANMMREPNLFAATQGTWEAAMAPAHKTDLTADGNFYRTLWHEVGHYLGVDRTRDGRDLDDALQDDANVLEEMKADLVSLFVAEALQKQGYYNKEQLQSVYASGILRVLQNNQPRRDQPYNTMQLMQWNFFLENGLLSFDAGKLSIHYEKYHQVVGKMLAKTLAVQYSGSKASADAFIDQYATWDANLHGVIARSIREQQRYRFRIFKYAALGE